REAAAVLPHERGDLARDLDRSAQVHVEGDQRPTGADDYSAGPLVQTRWAERRHDLPRVDAPLQLLGAAAPEERGTAAGCELSVHEHRQLELPADAPRDVERTRPRALQVLRRDRHHRDDVRGPDPGMRTLVTT